TLSSPSITTTLNRVRCKRLYLPFINERGLDFDPFDHGLVSRDDFDIIIPAKNQVMSQAGSGVMFWIWPRTISGHHGTSWVPNLKFRTSEAHYDCNSKAYDTSTGGVEQQPFLLSTLSVPICAVELRD